MPRTANPARPAELLDAIVAYLATHSVAELSLRPLAKAVGSSPRVLLYYFGSKEDLVVQALAHLHQQQRDAFHALEAAHADSLSATCRAIWRHMRAPRYESAFRLFFEAYGLALRHPRRFRAFLDTTVDQWLVYIVPPLRHEGYSDSEAHAIATVFVAGFRGFMLDYCATHDRARIDRAVDLWARSLDTIPTPSTPPERNRTR
jgi:AcrR family transcriptional regulator